MTKEEFWLNLSIVVLPLIIVLCYVKIVYKNIHSGLDFEKEKIEQGFAEMDKLKNGNWAQNINHVISFSGVTLSAVLVVTALMMQLDLKEWLRLYFNIVVLLAGLSGMTYAFSLQFWYTAVDYFPSSKWTYKQRRRATHLQSISWFGFYLSVALCITYLMPFLGAIFSLWGVLGIIYTFHCKNNPDSAI